VAGKEHAAKAELVAAEATGEGFFFSECCALDGLETHEGRADSFCTFHRAHEGRRTARTEEPSVGHHGEEGEGREDTITGPPEAKRKITPRQQQATEVVVATSTQSTGRAPTREASNKAPTETQGTRQ